MVWLWLGFIALVLSLLAIDLGVFHRRAHAVSMKESLLWSGVWVALALGFSVFVYFLYEYRLFGISIDGGGRAAATLFLTGYLIEESLSMDNLFVIAMVLTYFAVPWKLQHRVLFWGIMGAIVMRGTMIGAGVVLVRMFSWTLYLFGAFLIAAAVRMLLSKSEFDPRENFLVRQARRFFPVTDDFDGQRFVSRKAGRRALTPLALALAAVEGADAVFAVDSIPAIFAVTDVPFIIFTSNVFAILGLRSLYFALVGVMSKLRFFKASLIVLLMLIGLKLLLKDVLHTIPGLTYWTIGAILAVLAGGVAASLAYEPLRRLRASRSKAAN